MGLHSRTKSKTYARGRTYPRGWDFLGWGKQTSFRRTKRLRQRFEGFECGCVEYGGYWGEGRKVGAVYVRDRDGMGCRVDVKEGEDGRLEAAVCRGALVWGVYGLSALEWMSGRHWAVCKARVLIKEEGEEVRVLGGVKFHSVLKWVKPRRRAVGDKHRKTWSLSVERGAKEREADPGGAGGGGAGVAGDTEGGDEGEGGSGQG